MNEWKHNDPRHLAFLCKQESHFSQLTNLLKIFTHFDKEGRPGQPRRWDFIRNKALPYQSAILPLRKQSGPVLFLVLYHLVQPLSSHQIDWNILLETPRWSGALNCSTSCWRLLSRWTLFVSVSFPSLFGTLLFPLTFLLHDCYTLGPSLPWLPRTLSDFLAF